MKKNLFESEKNLCYEQHIGVNGSAAPTDCLRLEPNPKCFWLLSYHHLEFAAFESTQGEDIITMSFSQSHGANQRKKSARIGTRPATSHG